MHANFSIFRTVLAVGAFSLGPWCASVANAQVIVLQSTVAKYKSGSTLGKATQIAIPEGSLMVVVLPSGATRTINGPFDGKVAGLSKGGGRSNAALFNAVKKFVKTGGASTKKVGALRSARSSSSPTRKRTALPFSWSQIPLNVKGDVCLSQATEVVLYRASAQREQTVTVIDLTSTARARATFPAGVQELPWPVDVTLQSGNYAISPKGRKMSQVRVRMIDPLPSAEQTLQVLYGQRCFRQFQAYLNGLRTRVAVQQPQ